MAIRMSGLQSGMDTETLVNALVSGYNVQKDNLVKAQTKLQWKQDAWKSMNTSIYSFYTGKLSSARLSKTYNLKAASISDSTKAKVTASSSAVNGTQKLEIKKLASTGYLTGGTISKKDLTKADGGTKLSDITGGLAGNITVTADGRSTDIAIADDMTVNQFVVKLKDAGLNASFDENNQRFFISAQTSGASHDFALTASDDNGLKALQGLGLYTVNDTETAEYKKWAEYANDADALDKLKKSTYESKSIKYEDRAKTYADRYNNAKSVIKAMESDDTWVKGETVDSYNQKAADAKTALETQWSSYLKKGSDGNVVRDKDGNAEFDTDAIEKAGKTTEFEAQKKSTEAIVNGAKKYEDANKELAAVKDYVTLNSEGNAEVDKDNINANVKSEVDTENAAIKAASDKAIDDKVAYSQAMLEKITNGKLKSSSGAARITGSDAEIILNNATYTNNTNNFSINGLTIEASALTDGAVTITTNTDIDGIYKNIKDFFKEYNNIIKSMDEAYNATSAKGYEPLTSDEKEAMTDDEVEKWEKKIKDSLLRKDSTLGSASSSMKNLMAQAFEINGKKYSLASFGIKTQDYFSAGTNEKGVYHIDGDSDDSVSSGNDDKLRAAIANDPDTVVEFFSKLTTSVYNDLGNRMASSSTSSAFTLYNDKQMEKEYSTYTTKISSKEEEITTWEDYYYKKFSSMESALAKLNQTQSSLSGYFS